MLVYSLKSRRNLHTRTSDFLLHRHRQGTSLKRNPAGAWMRTISAVSGGRADVFCWRKPQKYLKVWAFKEFIIYRNFYPENNYVGKSPHVLLFSQVKAENEVVLSAISDDVM